MSTGSIKDCEITNPKLAKIISDIGSAIDDYNNRLDDILTTCLALIDDRAEKPLDRWLSGCIRSEIIERFVIKKNRRMNNLYRDAIRGGMEDYYAHEAGD